MDDARDAIVQPGPHNQAQSQGQNQAQSQAPNEAGARPPDGARLIEVSPMGGLGNRMIQFLAAVALAARVPGARLAKIHLPEWGIQIPPAEGTYRTEVVTWPPLALDRLAHALNTGALDRVDIRTYAQRMENFLPPEAYRATFTGPQVRGAGAGELLCNIRQGDIVDARHPDYVLLPIDFYADLVAKTGLSPVFIGQLDETPYLAALRRRFPAARFIPSQGAVADFAFIRASCHIVPAVSTFSWLAAWLSEAQSVHMPVVGLFHPRQAPATQLLPIGDARYHFSLFPFHYAVPVERATAAHATIRRLWREVPHAQLAAILSRTPPARDRAGEVDAFDEAAYLARYTDVAAVIAAGGMPSGRHHFEHYGFIEGRNGLALDPAWYCENYPIAALEMSEGEATDPHDHWVRIGRGRGYRQKEDVLF